ncbi:AAA family ATPase [Crocosphaera chwakensis]|uniref:Rad50/SbcC-type AAA domain-containing protein n=1 Tax=Crocosphaera chwakensis CCY0110 TaxID=391612 RepID=A3IU98_9CHRO|nr:hypothetical protein [Crocosphaera chwakensis]EAZ89972.1 hypothetical protein CY0110_07244 [Crocosphaera chwakensis CCY0110]
MKIEIISWECKGLRCPDMEINLMSGENPAHVALIQMPNGTGKTTILSLIRAALTRELSNWDAEKIKSYRRHGDNNPQGSFTLNLQIDNEFLTFKLMFNFEEGIVDSLPSYSIEDLESKINYYLSQNQHLHEKLEQKEKDLIYANEKVKTDVAELMDKIRKPQLLHLKFRESLIELKDKFDKAELPEKASRQFFIDLCNEKDCICGRELNDEIREIIKQRANLYLSNETAGFLNSLKSDIKRDLLSDDNGTEKSFKNSVDNLQDIKDYQQLIDDEIEYLKQEMINNGNNEVKEWKEELDKKTKEKNRIESELEEIEREPSHRDDQKYYEKTNCLKALKQWLEDEEIKLAEISNTIEMRQKKEILQKILKLAKTKANNNLRESIRNKCNQKLEKILYRDPISISDINHSITLKGQKAASMGQTLSVGYIFLTTLLSEGQHQFPLLVDSPANSIDITVRREIGQIIPSLCKQFIAFTISSEREGFTYTLANNADNIKFLTVFRKTETTKQLEQALPSKGVIDNKNCVIIEGKEYFNNFDLLHY